MGKPAIPQGFGAPGTRGTRGTPESEGLRRHGRSDWSGADWRAWFDERAGVLEHDGGHARAEAEARAFATVAAEWVSAHLDVDALPNAESWPSAGRALAALGIQRRDPCRDDVPPASTPNATR